MVRWNPFYTKQAPMAHSIDMSAPASRLLILIFFTHSSIPPLGTNRSHRILEVHLNKNSSETGSRIGSDPATAAFSFSISAV